MFFRDAAKALQELDCRAEVGSGGDGIIWTLADSRRCLLDKQKSILNRSVANYYNNNTGDVVSTITSYQVQARLSKLKDDPTLSSEVRESMERMDENARLALSRLVLYSECRDEQREQHSNNGRNLQKEGVLDRSRLLEFTALCQAAIKLECVQKYLEDGSPLFDDLPPSSPPHEEQPTAMKFPQTRMEKIQRLLSKAVGWDPDFTTQEIRRIFFEPTSTEYSNDKEIMMMFHDLVAQMNTAITYATLKASKQQLSDQDQGGVTRVVSVNYSEVTHNHDNQPGGSASGAPRKKSIDPSLSEEEQKRQIRLASEAARLQQVLLEELMNMCESERTLKLEEAKLASDTFLKEAMSLPAGAERIRFLQSIDSQTQQLLAMHKLWNGLLAENGGKPPSMAK